MNNSLDKQSTRANDQQDAFLRIKADKVTHLLDMVSELGLVATGVMYHPDLQELELEGFETAVHRLELLIRELQGLASSLRLVPIEGVFKRMRRAVRDLTRETGKQVDLVIKGEDTEIDKVLVDQLYDPLIHLVRNAVDHGIGEVKDRLAAGKSETGRITLEASQQGNEIQITVADDGRGLNREKILKRAREAGLVGPHDEPDDAAIWNYIFHSGFSTADEVSNLSGRGVGMDVVKTTIEALRGRITVTSRRGEGTRITLHIPLTLAFLDSMVVRLQNQLYAIPIDIVDEVIQPQAEQITHASAEESEMVRMRDDMVPVCRLQNFYGHEDGPRTLTNQVMVVVQTGGGNMGLPMDEVLGQQQVTMKPLQGQVKDIRAGAGYALLGTGEVALALDCERLNQALVTGNGYGK